MGKQQFAARRQPASPPTLNRGIVWLTMNSVFLYLIALFLRRAWVLLNTDVAHLIQRT